MFFIFTDDFHPSTNTRDHYELRAHWVNKIFAFPSKILALALYKKQIHAIYALHSVVFINRAVDGASMRGYQFPIPVD